MLKVAITGATGLIGSRVVELLRNDFSLIPLSGADFDITKNEKLVKNLKTIDFDILLHLAGYTDVDGAEKNKEIAFKVNVEGTKNVFELTQKLSKKFIYISTDFVFDGRKPPYFEDSIPNPLGYYAKTKYEGEKVVSGEAMIIRTAYPYGVSEASKLDFVRKIIKQLKSNISLNMLTDILITPTYIDDFAYALKYLINNFKPEIYHIIGDDSLSPYDATKLIAKIFNLNEALVKPTNFIDYSKNKAGRPQFSEVKNHKNNFYPMKTFEQGLTDLYNKSL